MNIIIKTENGLLENKTFSLNGLRKALLYDVYPQYKSETSDPVKLYIENELLVFVINSTNNLSIESDFFKIYQILESALGRNFLLGVLEDASGFSFVYSNEKDSEYIIAKVKHQLNPEYIISSSNQIKDYTIPMVISFEEFKRRSLAMVEKASSKREVKRIIGLFRYGVTTKDLTKPMNTRVWIRGRDSARFSNYYFPEDLASTFEALKISLIEMDLEKYIPNLKSGLLSGSKEKPEPLPK